MYTEDSFCKQVLDTTYDKACEIVQEKKYFEFEIPKKGGSRKISYLPKDSPLANLQRNLSHSFFCKFDLPICVKGFRRGESYNSFLYPHIGARFFLRIDIKSFFPSLTKSVIKPELIELMKHMFDCDIENLVDLICEIVTLNDKIPQGAYSSPILSNIIMARLDQRITKYCQIFNIKYTRYADDLLFSSIDFDFHEKRWFLRKIKYILLSKKLKLNYSKLKYAENELVLNGYIISSKGIRLSRNRLHDIRHIVAFVDKNYKMVFEDEATFIQNINEIKLKHRNKDNYKFESVFQLIQYLCGYRSFIISMLDDAYKYTAHQKNLYQLIRRIEKQIFHLNRI